MAGLCDGESYGKGALKLGFEPIMSKVNICWEILAGRTLDAENDRRRTRLKKLANSCTNHIPRNVFFIQIIVVDFI